MLTQIVISMHGIGGAKDLPIPPALAISGAALALVVSFVVLAVAWRSPRYDDGTTGHTVPRLQRLVESPWWTWAWRLVGIALLAFLALTAVFGKDLLVNPLFGVFYVWMWVGLVPLSLLFGPVWRTISPFRTLNALLAKVSGSDPETGLFTWPARLGVWPAAFGLFAFVWMELIYPHSTELAPVRLWLAAYLAAMLVGGALFGNTFYARADPFEVYSTLVSHLSVFGRRDGRLVVASPLANLATVAPRPGLVAVVSVLFGSTAFDSFKDSATWLNAIKGYDVRLAWLDFAAMLGFIVVVGLVLSLAAAAPRSDVVPRRQMPARFGHSVAPIIVGYVVAHYLSYLVEVGQQTLVQASDPLTRGANWFGTADWSVNYWLSFHPTVLASIKVLGVVLGHVAGVVAAHDRSIALLPRRHQVVGQLPLLVAMVVFTVTGLYLLFAA